MDTKTKILLISYLEQFVTEQRKEKIIKNLSLRTRHVAIGLEDIYKSQNSSAILRTCDALGVQDIHSIEGRNQLSVNNGITMGASKWLTIHRYSPNDNTKGSTTNYAIKQFKKSGYKVVATSPHAQQVLSDLPIKDKTLFLFGTEDQGLTEEALSLADTTIKIPMYGFVESYNVSVTAGLCLYDFSSRLRSSKEKWSLSEKETIDIKLDWLRNSIERYDIIEKRFLDQ